MPPVTAAAEMLTVEDYRATLEEENETFSTPLLPGLTVSATEIFKR